MNDTLTFAVHLGNRPQPAAIELHYPDGEQRQQTATGLAENFSALRRVSINLAPSVARQLKVWIYRVTREGSAEALPATVTIAGDGQEEQFDLALLGGQLVQPHDGRALRLEIAFSQS